MTSPGKPLLRVGMELRLRDEDYKFGTDELRLRVTEILGQPEPGWVRVKGVEIRWDGSDGGPRDVTVRVAAFRRLEP